MKLAFVAACLLLVASGVQRTRGSAIDSVSSPLVEAKCGARIGSTHDEAEVRARLCLMVALVTAVDLVCAVMSGLYLDSRSDTDRRHIC